MNIRFKSEQADICNVSKTKNKPHACTYVVEHMRECTKAPSEVKKPCTGGQ